MMKFMKRVLSLLISAMLLLGCFALAEETPLLPIAIVSYDLTDEATTAALSALIEPKENALTRWERVVLSDGREAWVICQFDQTTMSNAWSRVIDAETQEVLQEDTTDTGFFATAQARWESAKGIYALWSIQDKMLFDRLYAMARFDAGGSPCRCTERDRPDCRGLRRGRLRLHHGQQRAERHLAGVLRERQRSCLHGEP